MVAVVVKKVKEEDSILFLSIKRRREKERERWRGENIKLISTGLRQWVTVSGRTIGIKNQVVEKGGENERKTWNKKVG